MRLQAVILSVPGVLLANKLDGPVALQASYIMDGSILVCLTTPYQLQPLFRVECYWEMIEFGKLERTGEEVAVAYFKVL
jgi:hypothetical protein